jgi:PDZ domain-containing protein
LSASVTAAAIDIATTKTVTRNVDTTDAMLSGQPQPPESDSDAEGDWTRPPRRHRVLVVVSAVLGTLLLVSGVVAGLVRVPYDTVAPGTTQVVNEVITVEGHQTFPPDGEVMYATVSVRERVSVLQALIGWLDPSVDVIPEENLRGDIPPDQYRQLNVEAMSDSKTTAQVLALGRVGFSDLGVGAEIESVADGTPAAGVLRANDVVVEIDGKPIGTSDDAVTVIRAHQPGDRLQMKVRRDGGAPLDLSADLTRAEDGRALLGVRLTTKVELPFDITIDSGRVVGPSAGLAYALELLDLLTAGELTGGLKVAATGELASSGEVGPVGGVAQKVVAVKRAGADVFIVPKQNEAEAREKAGDGLRILPVSSFDEALTALGSVQGSNALALAEPSPGA